MQLEFCFCYHQQNLYFVYEFINLVLNLAVNDNQVDSVGENNVSTDNAY